MGDPRKIRKKYETPSHPWIKSRIDEEKRLSKEFGTKNKKELWKMETVLKKLKNQAKILISLTTDQAKIETELLFKRTKELGLATGDVTFDTVLGLTLDDLMARRLQSVVFKKSLAKTIKQARQFIVHGHINVNDKKVTHPSFLISEGDIVTLNETTLKNETFVKGVIDKRMNIGVKLPEWLELDKGQRKGTILRLPVRSDITASVEEHLIVELYSK